jgi:hypothetical protein
MKINEVVLGLYSIMRDGVLTYLANINMIGGTYTEMAAFSLKLEKEINLPCRNVGFY